MWNWGAAALLLLTMNMVEKSAATTRAPDQYAQLTVHQRIIVRVPFRPPVPAPRVEWKESHGPKCVPTRLIAGAALAGEDQVDLILRDNRRIRAKLESKCPALDYYYGFYITPNPDGQVCADRDIIRSRVGGQCEIDAFRMLTPVVRD